MVQSKLHENIQYVESHKLDEEEFGHESALYNLDMLDGVYSVAIGKKRDEYSHYDVFYFPIYLMSPENRIRAKVGVFEVEAKKVLNVYDDDDDLDLDKLDDPLLFNNVDTEFLQNYGTQVVEEDAMDEDEVKEGSKKENLKTELSRVIDGDGDNDNKKDNDSDDETNNMFKLPNKKESKKADQEAVAEDVTDEITSKAFLTLDSVFVKDKTLPSQISFPAETEEDARKFVSEYKEKQSSTDNWLQQHMKNKEYEILRNEGGGDCFFATLRDAYTQIGYNTTVAKLREFLSQEATQDMMEQYDLLYKNYVKENDFLEAEMDKSKKMMAALKKQSKKAATKEGQKEIIDEAKKLQTEYNGFKSKIELTKELMKEVQFMKSIENLSQFKQYIRTADYWADTWAISTLERILNIKVIIMEKSEDEHSTLQCGQMNDADEMYANYDPQYYIIVSKNDEHYELVSYRKKKMLLFSEIPYAVKFKVVEKCMEKNAGLYATIPAFKQFQMDLGQKPATAVNQDDVANIPQEEEGLYDRNVVFQFFEKSSNKKPGKGTGEKIGTPKEKGKRMKVSQRELDFDKLGKIPEWRQKLADTWTKASFVIDDNKWSSVSHYLMALPFEKEYPEIFKEFSLTSNSEISKNLEKAQQSIEKRKKDQVGKHYEVYKTLNETKDDVLREERKKALRAKFMAGDMTTLLNETKDAKLVLYRYGQEPKVDIDLMLLRKEIQTAVES